MERRRFRRVSARETIEFKPVGEGVVFKTTMTKDVGEGGVRITSEQFLARGAKLIARLFLPGMAAPLNAVCRVAWVEKMPYSDQYQMGVEFIDLSEECRELLCDFIKDR